MFESIRPPDVAARFRAIGVLPLAAVIVEQLYFTIAPLFQSSAQWPLNAVEVFLFVGGVDGVLRAIQLAYLERRALDSPAILWLVATLAISLFSVAQFIALVFPGRIF